MGTPSHGGYLLKEDRYGLQIPATKTEPKKVTIMVGTFLNEDSNEAAQQRSDGLQAPTMKTEPEKGSLYGGYLFERRTANVSISSLFLS